MAPCIQKRCYARKRWTALLLGFALLLGCDSQEAREGPTPFELELPARFPSMFIPPDNPMTVEGVALGERLFFDPILSKGGTLACADCHLPQFAFSDPKPFSLGANGNTGTRNSMSLTNVGWVPELFWDGRALSLEKQALSPVASPDELGEDWEHVVSKLTQDPRYPALFADAFETPAITPDLVVKAIAQFERTLISGNSKFDRFLDGEATLSPLEQQGFDLFFNERGDCFHCHGPVLFTDNRFHNNGLDETPADSGLAGFTGRASDVGKFRTPTLRNVEYTAPYMHDGRFQTLEEVIEHYSTGVKASATISPLMRQGTRVVLTEEEKKALVAFLKALSDPGFIQ